MDRRRARLDIDDLLTYGRALGTGQGLLGKKMATERLTSFPPSLGQYAYGLGGGVRRRLGRPHRRAARLQHDLYHDTTTDTTVVAMANSDIASGDCTKTPLPTDNPAKGMPCNTVPAGRVFQAVAEVLGHPIEFPPEN